MDSRSRLDGSAATVRVLEMQSFSPAEREQGELILSAQERDKAGRFRFQADREAYIAAHTLVRMSLSEAEPSVAPSEWIFRTQDGGRPELAGATSRFPLCFNLSHTHRMVACVVAHDVDCGIDIESVQRFDEIEDTVRSVLGPSEKMFLDWIPQKERSFYLAQFWTLKEAYAKALGLGLAMPFEKTEFALVGNEVRLVDQDADWTFDLHRCGEGYLVAVALRGRIRPVYRNGLPSLPLR